MKNQAEIIEIGGKTDETELIPVGKYNIQDLFIEQKGLTKLINEIEKKAFAAGQDATTDDGREIIRSTAYKIARSRTFLDGLGKNVVKKEKERVAKANDTRKKIGEETIKIQTNYRKPLTDYEEEQKRKDAEDKEREKKKIEGRIKQLQEYRCVLPYGEIANMTDEEFEEVLEREKKADENRKAEADRIKKEKEDLEAQKDEIRKQKSDAIIMRLTSFGFEFKDNYFTCIVGPEGIGIGLDELVDLDMAMLNKSLEHLAEEVKMAKIRFEKLKEEIPSEPDMDDINQKLAEASAEDAKSVYDPESHMFNIPETGVYQIGTVRTDSDKNAEGELSKSMKVLIDNDINIIHNWIDTLKAIAKTRPTFTSPHSDSVCEDVSISFVDFFDKTKDLVIQELR